MRSDDEIKKIVREKYGEIARGEGSCCDPFKSSCGCGSGQEIVNLAHGYDEQELAKLPQGAELGLGCGNPTSLIEVQPGWQVLDLGSGAGVDVFLMAEKVGPQGKVVGLDMTDDMLAKAKSNAARGGYANVEFVKGEIEQMPFPDNSFDLVISNCVINLVPDKRIAYREIMRVLKSGGQFAISDMATRGELPEEIRNDALAWAGCLAGALDLDLYLQMVGEVGFIEVEPLEVREYDFAKSEKYAILSVGLVGQKPL
ncbi:MAG: arsenite methyltransferase [bacterium]